MDYPQQSSFINRLKTEVGPGVLKNGAEMGKYQKESCKIQEPSPLHFALQASWTNPHQS